MNLAGPGSSESQMLLEAKEAPASVARLIAANADICRELGARLRKARPAFVVSSARGSSDNAASFAKYLLEIRLGMVTASVGPSVRSIYSADLQLKGALFLTISQSGRSPDILRLAEVARAGGAVTVALVNDASSPLAQICETVLPLNAWPERSVAATKSVICSLAAVLQLVAHWADDPELLTALERLPEDLERAAATDWSSATGLLQQARSLFVTGRGIGLAAALEAALKLKEICGIHAEALSAAELKHGPMTLAGADFPVMVMAQRDEALQSIADLVSILRERDVPVAVAGPAEVDCEIALASDPTLSPFTTPIALLQSFYPLVEKVAWARGRDPDAPPHLKKVTETV
jgi:glucosamine--fructose-6-phosphate aminotransferase (isomerizing)